MITKNPFELYTCEIDCIRNLFTKTTNGGGNKNLHMVFTDLEEAYNRVSVKVFWWVLAKKSVSLKYINIYH